MDVNDTHIPIVYDDKDYALELNKSFAEIGKVEGFKTGNCTLKISNILIN